MLVHPKEVILPELGERLGRYAQKKLAARKVEILINTHVSSYADGLVGLDKGDSIFAFTLIWTAGVTPGKLIADLPCKKEHGRLVVNENLEIPDQPGVWALGDCAWALDPATGKPFPTTAQHAVREGKAVARNILASIRNQPQEAFRFKMLGQVAAIGQQTGVAEIYGFRFSGFLAWLMWRTIYLGKLPRFEKKLQVALHWTMDLFFPKDLTQLLTPDGIRKAAQSLETSKAFFDRRDDS